MSKKKKQKSTFKEIRKIIRNNVWNGRDGKVHGLSVAADLIDREIVELAYQEGWANANGVGDGFTRALVTTKHPENYLLVNLHDSTFWGLVDGHWKAAKELRFTRVDGEVEVFPLADLRAAFDVNMDLIDLVEDEAPVQDAPVYEDTYVATPGSVQRSDASVPNDEVKSA